MAPTIRRRSVNPERRLATSSPDVVKESNVTELDWVLGGAVNWGTTASIGDILVKPFYSKGDAYACS